MLHVAKGNNRPFHYNPCCCLYSAVIRSDVFTGQGVYCWPQTLPNTYTHSHCWQKRSLWPKACFESVFEDGTQNITWLFSQWILLSHMSPRFKKEAVLERLWIQYKYLSFHLSLNLIFFLYISLCARVGKFYCKQHYGYRLAGMAQRKRPAPITAPPHSTQVRLSLAHLSRQSWRTHKIMITRVRSILMKLHCSPGGSECSTVGWMDSLETPDSITSWLPGLIGVLEYEIRRRRTGIGKLWFMGFPFLNSLVDIKLKQMST